MLIIIIGASKFVWNIEIIGNSKDNCNVLGDIIKEAKNEGYEIKPLNEFEK